MTLVIPSLAVVDSAASAATVTTAKLAVGFLNDKAQPVSAVTLQSGSGGAVYLAIQNTGTEATTTNGPLRVSLRLPAGMTVQSQKDLGARGVQGAPLTWSCNGGPRVTCVLVARKHKTPRFAPKGVDLLGIGIAPGTVPPGTAGLSINASVTLDGVKSPSAVASVTVTPAPPSTGVQLHASLPRQALAGKNMTALYRVSNPSAEAAVATAPDAPSISLSKILPPGQTDGWSYSGENWSCANDAAGGPVCRYTADVAVGASTPPLTITAHVVAGHRVATTALRSPPRSWHAHMTENSTGAGRVTGSIPLSLAIVPRPPGHLVVAAHNVGSSMLLPGGTADIEIKNRTIDGLDSGIVDIIKLPRGVTSSSMSSDGWVCPSASVVVTCTYAAPVSPKRDPHFNLILNGDPSLVPGVKMITVKATAIDGEAADTTAVPLFSFSFGGPRLSLLRMQSARSKTPVSGDARIVLAPGESTTASFRARNSGNKDLPVGSQLQVSMSLPGALVRASAGMSRNSMPVVLSRSSEAPGVTCEFGRRASSLVCRVTITRALAPGALSAPFSVTINDHASLADLGQQNAPGLTASDQADLKSGHVLDVAALVMGVQSTVARTSMEVWGVTRAATPDVSPLLSVKKPLVENGQSGTATVRMKNVGSAETTGSTLAMTFLDSQFSVAAIPGSACSIAAEGLASHVVTCTFAALAAGDTTSPALSPIATFTIKNVGATADVAVATTLLQGDARRSLSLPVRVSPTPLVQLNPPTHLRLVANGKADSLDVLFAGSSNAPVGQHYVVKLCTDSALTIACRTRDVSIGTVLTELSASTTYYGVVTALPSQGYLPATSNKATGRTAANAQLPQRAPPVSALASPSGVSDTSHAVVNVRPQPVVASADASASTSPRFAPTPVVPDVTMVAPRIPKMRSAGAPGAASPAVVVPPATGESFCDLVALASSTVSATLTENLGGGISATLNGALLVGGPSCSAPGTSITFTGGTLNLYGEYSATVGSGSITATGLSTTSTTTLTTPQWWGSGSSLSLTTTSLSLPFAGSEGSSSVSVAGTFTNSSLFGFPTPSGWSPQTSLTFGLSAGSPSISISSSGGPAGTQTTIAGTASTTGTYSVTVSGSLVLDGVVISNVSASWGSSSLTASGSITIGGQSVSVSLAYADSNDWTLSPSGTSSIFGQSVTYSGQIVDTAGSITGSFQAAVNATLGGGITSAMTMTWTADGGTALSGSGSVTFPSGGSASVTTATYQSASSYSITATASSLVLSSSVSLNVATVTITETAGVFGCALAGTVAVGTGSVTTSGTYADATDWSLNGTASSIAVSASVTLSTFAIGVSQTTAGGVVSSISGTLAIGSGSVLVSGTYNGAYSWTVTSTATSLPLSSGISLSSATGTITATPPSGSATTGTISATFTGTLAIGSGSVLVSGTYNGAYSWTVTGGVASLAIASGISLTTATATITETPTGGSTTAGTIVAGFSGTFVIWGVTTTASGAVNVSTGAQSFTIFVTGPISVVPGLNISSLSATWSSSTGLAGTASINLGSANIAITMAYSSDTTWSFQVTAGSSGSVAITPQLSLSGSSFQGTITETNGVVNWSMSVSVSSVTLVNSFLSLQNVVFTISSSCSPVATCPSGTNSTYLGVSGSLVFALGSGLGTQTLSIAGTYGVQSGGFVFTASMSQISVIPGILVINSPTVTISYGDSQTVSTGNVQLQSGAGSVQGYTINISGSVTLNLPGDTMTVSITATYGGSTSSFEVVADLPDGGSLGSTGAALTTLAYTSVAETITLDGLIMTTPAGSLVVGGSLALPTWIAQYLGAPLPSVSIFAIYSSATNYSVSAAFNDPLPMSTGSSDFAFAFDGFTVTVGVNASGPYQELSSTGTMTTSGSAGSSSFNVTLSLTYLDTGTLTGTIEASGTGCSATTPGLAGCDPLWSNAFGMSGVNVETVAISVGIEIDTTPIPLPSLGLAATLTIGGPLLNDLGIQNGTPLLALIDLSVTSPCMDIQVGTEGSSTAFINLGNGVITANYADLVLAPDGCTVGSYVVPPGYAFDFQGSFLGVDVTYESSITTSPSIAFTGYISVGEFSIDNYVTFEGATVSVAFSTSGLGITFSGAASVVGVSVQLAGSVSYNGGAFAMSLTGALGNFDVYGISISDASFTVAYTQLGDTPTSFTLSCTGAINILGNSIDVNQMTFTYANGVVDEIYLNVSANINISGIVNLDGNFTFQASTSSQNFVLTATGTLTIPGAGFTIQIDACPSGDAGLTITTTYFNLCSGLIALPFFQANISGYFYWTTPSTTQYITTTTGNTVAASAGDFSFSATNVSLGVAGFGLTGSVVVSEIGGTTTGSVATAISLSNTSSDSPVSIAGTFSSNGDFTFTGSGNVTLAAVTFGLQVTAAASGTSASVTATTALNLSGASIGLTGTFSTVSGGVAVSMTASADVNIDSFDLGSATITLSVAPGDEAIAISDSMNLGGVFTAQLNASIQGNGSGQATFSFTIDAGISVVGVSVSGDLSISNQSGSLVASVAGQFQDAVGTSYNFTSVPVNADWSFSYTSSGSVNNCSGTVNLGIVQFYACFSGSYNITISTSSPTLSFATSLSATLAAQNLILTTSCHGVWWNPSTWSCTTSTSWGNWSNIASIGASINSNGLMYVNYDGAQLSFQV